MLSNFHPVTGAGIETSLDWEVIFGGRVHSEETIWALTRFLRIGFHPKLDRIIPEVTHSTKDDLSCMSWN